MLKISTIAMVLGLTIFMSGCASDVDKCVEAQVKEYGEDSRASAHIICLQASSGNK